MIVRDGDWKTINITLEEIEAESRTFASDDDNDMSLGLEVKNLSSTLAERFNLDADIDGVVVTNIDKNSNAYEVGIRAGDVITRVGTKKVLSTSDFKNLVKEAKEQDSLLLLVKRGV